MEAMESVLFLTLIRLSVVGLTATPTGFLPTVILAVALFVEPSITETVFEPMFVTYGAYYKSWLA